MIAYIALLIFFINLLLRVFHGKQKHGRIVGGFLREAWDKIRCTIHALVPFVVAICEVLLALYAGIFAHSSLKMIGVKVYFWYRQIIEIDDLTTLLWDRVCDALAATLAVALVVWTVYWFFYFIYVPLRFLFPWLLLLKRKLVGRGRIRWKPDRMMLKNRYVGDAPPNPTGVTAPRILRIPRYTRMTPVLDDQRLAAVLVEFDRKQDRYICDYRTDPRYDHWRGWVRTPAAIEPVEALADPVERHVRWKPDRMMTQDIHVGDIPPVPTRVPAKRVLRRARYTRVIPVLNDEQLAVAMLEFDAGQEESIHHWDSDLQCDHWRGWVRTPAAIGPAEATDNNPIADDASDILDVEPAEDTENNLNAVDKVVPDVVEEPWEALNEPVTVDDAPDDVEVGVPVAPVEEPVVEALDDPAVGVDDAAIDGEAIIPAPVIEEAAVAEAMDDPAIAAHDVEEVILGVVAEEPDDTVMVQDMAADNDPGTEEDAVAEAMDNPAIAAHDDEEVVLGVVAEEPDDTVIIQDMAADNDPGAEEDVVPDAVLVRNKEKQTQPVTLRRSPRLGGVTGSVFFSSNTGRVVRRSARIMSRR